MIILSGEAIFDCRTSTEPAFTVNAHSAQSLVFTGLRVLNAADGAIRVASSSSVHNLNFTVDDASFLNCSSSAQFAGAISVQLFEGSSYNHIQVSDTHIEGSTGGVAGGIGVQVGSNGSPPSADRRLMPHSSQVATVPAVALVVLHCALSRCADAIPLS